MKIKYFERVTKEAYLADIMELLSLCDQEFIPPLSARSSTIQSNLGPQGGKREGPVAYFENIQHQPAFLAVDDGRVVGFMSLKKNYVCEEIPPSHSPNVYVTTVIVHPHYAATASPTAFITTCLKNSAGAMCLPGPGLLICPISGFCHP